MFGFKREAVPEEKSNDELYAGIGDYYYYYPLVIDDDMKMCDMSGVIFSMNKHSLYQQYCALNHVDVCSGYDFFKQPHSLPM